MMRSLSLAALLVTALAGCRSDGMSDEDRLAIYSESAYVHYEQGRFAHAEKQALKGLEIDREDVPLNLMMGWLMLRRDQRDALLRAEQVFRRLLDDAEDYRAQLGLATALERLGALHHEAALAVAAGERATDAASPEAGARELAELAHEHWNESLALYQRALEVRAKNLKALNGSMRVLAQLDRHDESLATCDVLLETLVHEREFWTGLLQSEDLDEDDEDGLRQQVTDSLELEIEACLFAANLEHDLGRHEAALDRMNRVLELDPDLPEGYSMRAQLLAATGRLEDAVADLDRYIARSEKPYEHPDIKRAFELLTDWNRELRRSARR